MYDGGGELDHGCEALIGFVGAHRDALEFLELAEEVLDEVSPLVDVGVYLAGYGTPDYIRSDNGPEFIALTLRQWIADVGTRTAYIEPGSPWENGYCESVNSKLRGELLNLEVFSSLREAEVLIESWRQHFNTVRPHSSLGYVPPAPETMLPRSGGRTSWPSAPAVEGARPAKSGVAAMPTLH